MLRYAHHNNEVDIKTVKGLSYPALKSDSALGKSD